MTHNSEPHASKVPEVTLGFWIIKILATTLGETGGDTVTMTWLKADVMVNSGYLVGTCDFSFGLDRARRHSNRREEISPFPLLGGDRGLDDSRHSHGRLCNSFFGYRLHRRIVDLVRLSHGRARPVVLVAGFNFGRDGQHAKGGSLLLGGDYVFPDLRNRSRRLDRGYRRPRIRRRSARVRCRISGHCCTLLLDGRVAGPAVLGRIHSNATTWAPPLAISSTSP